MFMICWQGKNRSMRTVYRTLVLERLDIMLFANKTTIRRSYFFAQTIIHQSFPLLVILNISHKF